MGVFEQYYQQVPPAQRQALKEFRASHPYQHISLQGQRWSYLSSGRGAHTLLILPWWFFRADVWHYPISTLENSYRILAPDPPPGPLSLDGLVEGLLAMLEQEGVEKVVPIGYSSGGYLAQYFLQAYPARVEAMVLALSTAVDSALAEQLDSMRWMLEKLPLSLLQFTLRGRVALYPSRVPWADFTRAYVHEQVDTQGKEGLLQHYRAHAEAAMQFRFDAERLSEWAGEMLLLSAKDDLVTLEKLDQLKERYPKAKSYTFEGGSAHLALLVPEIYTSILRVFLDGMLGYF